MDAINCGWKIQLLQVSSNEYSLLLRHLQDHLIMRLSVKLGRSRDDDARLTTIDAPKSDFLFLTFLTAIINQCTKSITTNLSRRRRNVKNLCNCQFSVQLIDLIASFYDIACQHRSSLLWFIDTILNTKKIWNHFVVLHFLHIKKTIFIGNVQESSS